MELHGCSVRPSSLLLSTLHTNPNFSYKVPSNFSVVSSVEIKIWNCLSSVRLNASVRRQRFSTQSMWRASNIHSRRHGFYPSKLQKFIVRVRKTVKFTVHFRDRFPEIAFNLVVGVMVFMTISLPVAKSPSWALTEENLLFLEAWRTIDRAYVDKTFNGQSWFRYRENALRSEPMNTREETCGGGSSRGRRQRRGEDVVHPLKVSLEDLYGGTSKKLSLSRNVLCSKCNGKGSKSGASMTCSGCQGSGMKVSIRQLGPSMIQQMQHPCNECKGTGESISDKDRCTQCKGEKVVPEKKVLDVHVEKGMQNGQKITFPGEADEALLQLEKVEGKNQLLLHFLKDFMIQTQLS